MRLLEYFFPYLKLGTSLLLMKTHLLNVCDVAANINIVNVICARECSGIVRISSILNLLLIWFDFYITWIKIVFNFNVIFPFNTKICFLKTQLLVTYAKIKKIPLLKTSTDKTLKTFRVNLFQILCGNIPVNISHREID